METHITSFEFLTLVAAAWLPLFGAAAALHWVLLAERRWRAAWAAAACFLEVALALAILFSPIADLFLFLGVFGEFLAITGMPLQAGLLSALLVTLAMAAFVRFAAPAPAPRPPKPLRDTV